MLRPLRIAHVTDFYAPRVGGIEIHVAGLVGQQRRCGHLVDVITAEGVADSSLDGAAPRPTPRRGVHTATSTMLAGGYDVVHVHAGLATPIAFAAARAAGQAGLPTTVTLHSMIGGLGPWYRAADVAAGWREWPVAWTAVSDAAAAPLRRLIGPGATVDVLPNAIDLDAWRPRPRQPRPPGELVVMSVMRLTHRKRPLPLLRLLHDAHRALSPTVSLRAVIVGDGPQRGRAERYLTRHGMDWVQLVGLADHDTIRDLFRGADLFVAPAHRESFGIAALEARASGLPVLAMTDSGVGEFLDPGAGRLVTDDRAMSEAIVSLGTDPAELAALTVHNHLVRPAFGWPDTLQRTAHVYERAARISGAPLHRPLVAPVTAARARRRLAMASHA